MIVPQRLGSLDTLEPAFSIIPNRAHSATRGSRDNVLLTQLYTHSLCKVTAAKVYSCSEYVAVREEERRLGSGSSHSEGEKQRKTLARRRQLGIYISLSFMSPRSYRCRSMFLSPYILSHPDKTS